MGPVLPAMPSTLTLIPSATKAGTLPSDRVVRRGHRRYYDPLGLPLRTTRFRHRLIRARAALTRAAQTGLSCSVPLRAHVLRPLPRRDLPRDLRTETRQTWPSPRHDRLGSRVVNLSRLQASLDVAARVLAPSVEALDTPLGPPGSLPMPGVCYSALRRLPRRDLHPLEKNDLKQTMFCLLRHDAPWTDLYGRCPQCGTASADLERRVFGTWMKTCRRPRAGLKTRPYTIGPV